MPSRLDVEKKRNETLLTLRRLRPSLLNDQLIQPQLLRRPLEHALLDTAFGDEPEHVDLLRLTDTVSAIHGLKVGLRVPVGVGVSIWVIISVKGGMEAVYARRLRE